MNERTKKTHNFDLFVCFSLDINHKDWEGLCQLEENQLIGVGHGIEFLANG